MAGIYDNFKKNIEIKSFYPNQIKVINTYFMLSETFNGETKKSVKNNEGGLDFFKSKSDHSDEQKESKIC